MANNYNLTVSGFDAMEVLNVFHKKLEELGASPVEIDLTYEELLEGITAEPTKEALPLVLKQMMDAGLIYRDEG